MLFQLHCKISKLARYKVNSNLFTKAKQILVKKFRDGVLQYSCTVLMSTEYTNPNFMEQDHHRSLNL